MSYMNRNLSSFHIVNGVPLHCDHWGMSFNFCWTNATGDERAKNPRKFDNSMLRDSFYLREMKRVIRMNLIEYSPSNKPIQDGGEAKAPLWLNRLSGTN